MAVLTYDNRSSNSLTGDTRSSAGSFTNDSKSSTGLTGDNRSSAGSFTNDNRNNGLALGLWLNNILPWSLAFPWTTTTDGQILTKDIRN